MTKTETKSTVLLKHHLKSLKLPTMHNECEKIAQRCAADNADHLAYLLQLCELELTGALRREGLSAATVEHLLGRLDAPELDDTERLLLPLARETLWYEPAVLQRRVRGLREALTPPQALGLYGGDALRPGQGLAPLAPGACADLCVTDRPWREMLNDLAAVQVRLTLCRGEPIWAA